MENDKKIKSLEGCLIDFVYMTSEDWETYNKLKAKAAKWDDPQTQSDLELAQAVKVWFSSGRFIESSNVECWSEQDFIGWYREQKRGAE